MDPALSIALLWAAFAAHHMILSSVALRPRLVAVVGEPAFQGIYSLLALAIFVPLVSIYFANKHAGVWLWDPIGRGPVGRWAVYLLMGTAFVMVIAGALKPSPASVAPGAATASGIHRITRHPLVFGLGLFGLAHLLPNGASADVAFFAGFALFGALGSWHQDRRKLATGSAEFRSFYENTRFVPFTGGQSLRGLLEIPWWHYALGIGLTVGIRWFHASWFGA